MLCFCFYSGKWDAQPCRRRLHVGGRLEKNGWGCCTAPPVGTVAGRHRSERRASGGCRPHFGGRLENAEGITFLKCSWDVERDRSGLGPGPGPGPLVRDWVLGRVPGSFRIFQKIRFAKGSWGPGPDRSGSGPGPDARMPKEVDFVKVHGVSGLEWVGAGPGPGPGPLVLDRLSWIVGPGLGFRAC